MALGATEGLRAGHQSDIWSRIRYVHFSLPPIFRDNGDRRRGSARTPEKIIVIIISGCVRRRRTEGEGESEEGGREGGRE